MGSLEGPISVDSREDCAKLCDDKADCRSFEHSHSENKCGLNKEWDGDAQGHGDYVFCSKRDGTVLLI